MANAAGLARDDRSDFDVPVDQRETSADRTQQTVGQDLRAARLRRGITPEVIWRDLKIAPHHLIALEDGCFDTLPGRVYVVGFVRSYARYIGLDVEKCLARLKAELPGSEIKPLPVIGSVSLSEPDGRLGGAPVESVNTTERDIGLFSPREHVEISPERGMQQYVVIGFTIAVLVYGGYNVFSSARLTAPPAVVPVPARLATEAGISPTKTKAPAVVVNPQGARIVPASVPMAPAVLSPSDAISVQPLASIEPTPTSSAEPKIALPTESVAINPDIVRPRTKVEPAPASSVEPARVVSNEAPPPAESIPAAPEQRPKYRPPLPLGTRYGLENGNSRVVLRLHRSIRIAVKGTHNHVFIDRILGAGATYRVPNAPGVKLSVPDAGAVEVILDGNTVGFAGKDGSAAKSLGLDPPSIIRRYHWR